MAPPVEHSAKANKSLVTDFLAEVVTARNADAVVAFVAPDLVQHGADVRSGAQAYADFLRRAFEAEHASEPLEPVFVVAEKDLVSVCFYLPQPDSTAPGGFFDYYSFTTYRICGGRIAERWPSVNKIAPPRLPAPGTPSRAANMSSAPDIDVEANKRLVVDFYRCVFDAQNPDAVKDFVAPDYRQHVSHYPPGRSGLTQFVRTLFPHGPVPTAPEPLNPPALLVAEGDIVVVAGLLPQPEPDGSGASYPYFAYDAYRVRERQLAEHWSGTSKAAPPKHPGPSPVSGT